MQRRDRLEPTKWAYIGLFNIITVPDNHSKIQIYCLKLQNSVIHLKLKVVWHDAFDVLAKSKEWLDSSMYVEEY